MKERKYGKYFLTEPELINKPRIPMSNPSAYVDSASHFGKEINFSMALNLLLSHTPEQIKDLLKKFGFTVEHVVAAAKAQIDRVQHQMASL